MSTRVPTRGAMMPAIGATNIGASVHGVVCTAASSGVEPCTTCMYWIRMNTAPNVPKLNAKPTMFVTENERSRNRRSGTSGAFARACQSRNTTQQHDAADDLGDHAGRSPAVVVAAHDRVHQTRARRPREHGADHVDARALRRSRCSARSMRAGSR